MQAIYQTWTLRHVGYEELLAVGMRDRTQQETGLAPGAASERRVCMGYEPDTKQVKSNSR